MKANELRIGNLFIYEVDKSINTVSGLSINSIVSLEIGLMYNSYHCQPIPLTEEWLIKFGFTSSFTKVIGLLEFNIIWSSSCEIEVSKQTIQINHVHQLQNLYFALTGEELEIK